jgi:serine-type D-Ala-D-Ala carboxypeptidase (penicillin-binding protein 5/6)
MRFLARILMLTLIFNSLYPIIGHANEHPSVSATNAVLIEQSTGRILFEKNAHEKSNIASITKIMTAIIAIESGKMKETATASRNAVYTEGSSIYLKQGEKMTVEDLVYGLMLRSGNDAAVTIAEHVGESEEGFVFLMNEKAKWLGMTNTHFDNPHGLDSETHYSSAYDMAILMRYAMQNEEFRKVTGAKFYHSDSRDYGWKNKNKLLTVYYKYCTGGKTGFTKQTGRTLVSTASKGGMDLIAVTLNAPNDWEDHTNMFEWGFENFDMTNIGEKGPIFISLDSGEKLKGYTHEEAIYPLSEAEIESVRSEILSVEQLDENHEDLVVGKQIYYLQDEPILEVAIFKETLPEKKNSFLIDFVSVLIQIFRVDTNG